MVVNFVFRATGVEERYTASGEPFLSVAGVDMDQAPTGTIRMWRWGAGEMEAGQVYIMRGMKVAPLTEWRSDAIKYSANQTMHVRPPIHPSIFPSVHPSIHTPIELPLVALIMFLASSQQILKSFRNLPKRSFPTSKQNFQKSFLKEFQNPGKNLPKFGPLTATGTTTRSQASHAFASSQTHRASS